MKMAITMAQSNRRTSDLAPKKFEKPGIEDCLKSSNRRLAILIVEEIRPELVGELF